MLEVNFMCTALTLKTEDGHTLFGRNMDLEYSFNQKVHLIPRNYTYTNHITGECCKTKYAVLAMGILLGSEKHPTLADGVNEKGLGCAGLNFPDYVHYEPKAIEGKTNIAPYDIIFWILNSFESVAETRQAIMNLNIVGIPFDEQTPLPTLHWIVSDSKGESIVIESTKEKIYIHDNLLGVLTNPPTFDWHITHLSEFVGLSSYQAENTSWCGQELAPGSHGLGAYGLPGDYSSISRFVRIAFLKSVMPTPTNLKRGICEFFHLLGGVAMTNGIIIKPGNQYEVTLYSSCMCLEKGTYSYTNYTNHRINCIDMHKENLDATDIKVFEYFDDEDIHYQN